MKRPSFLAPMCLLSVLFGGCDSDGVLDQIDPEEAAAVVAGASTQVLVPVVERLDLLTVFRDIPSTTGAGLASGAVNECTSGTWEHCERPQGFEYAFDACVLDGESVTGTLSATGSDVAGTVSFDLSVDNLGYEGFVTFSQPGDCIEETTSQFQVHDGTRTSVVSGELIYCPGSSYPTGTLGVTVSGASAFSIDATFDGTQSVEIVFDGGTGQSHDCTAGLATGGANCG